MAPPLKFQVDIISHDKSVNVFCTAVKINLTRKVLVARLHDNRMPQGFSTVSFYKHTIHEPSRVTLEPSSVFRVGTIRIYFINNAYRKLHFIVTINNVTYNPSDVFAPGYWFKQVT